MGGRGLGRGRGSVPALREKGPIIWTYARCPLVRLMVCRIPLDGDMRTGELVDFLREGYSRNHWQIFSIGVAHWPHSHSAHLVSLKPALCAHTLIILSLSVYQLLHAHR